MFESVSSMSAMNICAAILGDAVTVRTATSLESGLFIANGFVVRGSFSVFDATRFGSSLSLLSASSESSMDSTHDKHLQDGVSLVNQGAPSNKIMDDQLICDQ